MIRVGDLFRPLSPGRPPRSGAALLAVLLLLPFWGGSYVMDGRHDRLLPGPDRPVVDLMLGFAGLLSIGHALFVGIGAYASAYLFAAIGLPPVIGASCRPSLSRSWPGC